VAISALYEGRAYNDKAFVYFYLRCDDGPVLSVQFWDVSAAEFIKAVGYDDIKARRVELNGMLAGTYEDTPTIVVELGSIEVGPCGI